VRVCVRACMHACVRVTITFVFCSANLFLKFTLLWAALLKRSFKAALDVPDVLLCPKKHCPIHVMKLTENLNRAVKKLDIELDIKNCKH